MREIGEEVERASIENHLALTSMSENQLAAFHGLIFEVGCRCPVGERHVSQLEKPIGLRHALGVAIHGYEVVDQRRLLPVPCAPVTAMRMVPLFRGSSTTPIWCEQE